MRKKHRKPQQHTRKYRKGKKVINRGVKYRRRASKLRRDVIRKNLKTEGKRKHITRIMEKDPLLWKEYGEVGYPEIIVAPNLLKDEDAFALADLKNKKIMVDKEFFEGGSRETEKSLKKKGPYKPEAVLDSDIPITPRQLLVHEIQHFKDKDRLLKSKSLDEGIKDLMESSAIWKSHFDIRKFKTKKNKEITEKAFAGPILKKNIVYKEGYK